MRRERAQQPRLGGLKLHRRLKGELEAAGVPTGRVQDMAQALRDPQVLARNMVLPVTPRAGGPVFSAAGNPIKMSTLPELTHRRPAPGLDADRQTILNWLNT